MRKIPAIVALVILAVATAALVDAKQWRDLAELWIFSVLGYAYARWGSD